MMLNIRDKDNRFSYFFFFFFFEWNCKFSKNRFVIDKINLIEDWSLMVMYNSVHLNVYMSRGNLIDVYFVQSTYID